MTDESVFVAIASIVVLGIGSQWIARRAGIPGLLLLLPAGLFAGATGLVNPEKMFGEALSPVISTLVALLLFQAGLSLRTRDLPKNARRPVVRLVVVGGTITFFAATGLVLLVVGVPPQVAFVMGAILVVSGPTVVNPLLNIIRAKPPLGAILNWESTTLDPIGAVLGVAVLNVVVTTDHGFQLDAFSGMLVRMIFGIVIGVVAAFLLVTVMRLFLVTDEMEPAVALLFAIVSFSVAESLLSESGLVSAVVLGLVVANQNVIPTRRINGFGETLDVLIIGTLFILLGSLVTLASLWEYALEIVIIVLALVLVVRPIATAVALARSQLTWRQRGLVAWVDPRGIVAASTAAQFAGVLGNDGFDTEMVLPVVFGVVFGTGLIYGLTAKWVASRLRVRKPDPSGVAILGHGPFCNEFSRVLLEREIAVTVITPQLDAAVAAGAFHVSLLESAHQLQDDLTQADLAWVVVSEHPSGAVQMATSTLVERLGRRRVLAIRDRNRPSADSPGWAAGSRLWHSDMTTASLNKYIERGGQIVELTDPSSADLVLAVVHEDQPVDLVPSRRSLASGTVLGMPGYYPANS